MFDATEPAALARQLFGPPGQDYVLYGQRRRRSPKRFDAAVRANAESIWDLGDWAYRDALLNYGASKRVVELWTVMWKALNSGDDRLASLGLMAIHGLLKDRQPDPEQVSSLIRFSKTRGHYLTRMFAVYVLRDLEYPRLDDLLAALCSDTDVNFRFNVNLQRLRMGHEVSTALLDDLPSINSETDGLQSLWYVRDKLTLTPVQTNMLWDYITKEAASIRRRCMTEQYYPPTAKLISYLRNGLPMKKGDIGRLAQSVFKPDLLSHQRYVIHVIGAFKSDEARIWLRRILDSEVRPSLRRLAASELKRIQATPGRG